MTNPTISFKIEAGIPFPVKHTTSEYGNALEDFLSQMEVGDSFLVGTKKEYLKITIHTRKWTKKTGRKIIFRGTPDGYRGWRKI